MSGTQIQMPSPSVRPSVHPSVQNGVGVCTNAPARTRGSVPDEGTVVETATAVMGVEAAFARWWYREMAARDWRNTNGTLVGNANWRPTLKAWRNRATADELAKIEAEARRAEASRPKAWRAEDWLLCAERCARFRGRKCQCGCSAPPDRLPRPIPPEECPHFEANAPAPSGAAELKDGN